MAFPRVDRALTVNYKRSNLVAHSRLLFLPRAVESAYLVLVVRSDRVIAGSGLAEA